MLCATLPIIFSTLMDFSNYSFSEQSFLIGRIFVMRYSTPMSSSLLILGYILLLFLLSEVAGVRFLVAFASRRHRLLSLAPTAGCLEMYYHGLIRNSLSLSRLGCHPVLPLIQLLFRYVPIFRFLLPLFVFFVRLSGYIVHASLRFELVLQVFLLFV